MVLLSLVTILDVPVSKSMPIAEALESRHDILHDLRRRSQDHPKVAWGHETYPGQYEDRLFPVQRGTELDIVP